MLLIKSLSPARGIFDKLLGFFTTSSHWIAVNKAFDWLSKEENREQITGGLVGLVKTGNINWSLPVITVKSYLNILGAFLH